MPNPYEFSVIYPVKVGEEDKSSKIMEHPRSNGKKVGCCPEHSGTANSTEQCHTMEKR